MKCTTNVFIILSNDWPSPFKLSMWEVKLDIIEYHAKLSELYLTIEKSLSLNAAIRAIATS